VLGGYAVFAATYVPINRWSVGRPSHVLYLPGEEALPFAPSCEYLYGLSYLLPWLLLLGVRELRTCLRCTLAFALILVVAYATYLAFPVYLERPALVPSSLAERLLALEYRDPSYNHFPSLHVALTWLVYLACRERLGSLWLLPLAVAVSASTLFVKQHYVIDVLYGVALALAAWRAAGRLTTAWLTARKARP
jgi:membrane-associated phospholipid phosphatase